MQEPQQVIQPPASAAPLKAPSVNKKILFGLPPRFMAAVDWAAKKEYRSRSGLIREALRMYLLKYPDMPVVESDFVNVELD
jgi:hypothetical protein